jgi:preprotein translocase subunit SecD
MLDFPRWKILSIWAVIAFGILLSVPSFFPQNVTDSWPVRVPRINLGLDLAGGSHLLFEADTDDVARQRLATMYDAIGDEMKKATPRIEIGEISRQGGKLSFMVRDPSRLDAAVEQLRPLTQGVGMTGQRDWNVKVVNSNQIELTPTQDGIKLAIADAMKTATEVVRKRIDALGTKEPTIVSEGTNRISVQVPGLQDPQALKELIGKTARLEFKLVNTNVNLTGIPGQVPPGANFTAPIGSELLPNEDGNGGTVVYRRVIISGDQLTDAQQSYTQDQQPDVNIKFNSVGGKRFAKVTQENVGKPFAIILDGKVLSAPNIQEPILGGSAQITGNYTVDTANQLAIALRSGKLPIKLKVIEERTVGPQLGADSIRAGVLASAIATVAVIVFMLLTYGRFGVYANLAVVINIFIIVGVMGLFGFTLTLPGIAGFVLTIGTAVDANVLINERIREERRRGRNVSQSVELGYKEASRTIFEANATHAIAGLIMLVLGTGPVKGFALVLLIGIATSVFTAVLFTRMMVALWLRRTRPRAINI